VKVFFDTNVHVSDAIYGGAAARAITATLKARWKVFACPTVLTELDRIIRTKFHRSSSFANATVRTVRDISEIAEEASSAIGFHEILTIPRYFAPPSRPAWTSLSLAMQTSSHGVQQMECASLLLQNIFMCFKIMDLLKTNVGRLYSKNGTAYFDLH
jgi:hypothetical protein